MSESTYFSYTIVRCVDEVRDEALNVGVVVLDSSRKLVEIRVTEDLGRIKRTLPNVPTAQLKATVESLPEYFRSLGHDLSVQFLEHLAREWGNGLRLSAVRAMQGESLRAVADELYRRYVASPKAVPGIATKYQPRVVSSHRIVRSVASRLKRKGLELNRDYIENAKVPGRTRNNNDVPVWFPLLVSDRFLVDAMELTQDEVRALDTARLIATKSYEVLRGGGRYEVNIVVGESDDLELNTTVKNVLLDEGGANGRRPEIYWKGQLDEMIEIVVSTQYSAL
ncbi:MAG: hypothetical protein KatS3mg082_3055 [Nitrospiraceae bacterium]|nr:MAG: hypothetical protein KatS3mg082_3055 [Nitrospiraceae bacterium]